MAAKQIAVGVVSGWAAGFVCGKFGRVAATAVGGTAICLQLAQKYGYVTIDWKKVDKDVAKVRKELEKKAESEAPQLVQNVRQFVQDNGWCAGAFAGGFLLGLVSS